MPTITERVDRWFNRPDENRTRGNWPGRLDYVMVSVSYVTGVGNLWLFPYLVYSGGGVVYLIPYLSWTMLLGAPLYYLEASFGQFAGTGPITVWNISPIFKGVGYSTIFVCFVLTIAHGTLVAWAVLYFFCSFIWNLPWVTCGNWWNSDKCNPDNHQRAHWNYTVNEFSHVTATEEHFSNRVLLSNQSVLDGGYVQWEVFGCLSFVWILVFLSLTKGVRSLGKVSYLTALLPYPLLVMLLIRGLTLPGGVAGVREYLLPTHVPAPLHTLRDWNTWMLAASHVVHSMGTGLGAHPTFASYNSFHFPCRRSIAAVYVVHILTCLLSGITVFSLIGHSVHLKQEPFEDIALDAGAVLVFQSLAGTLASIPASNFWSLVFYLLVFVVGFGPQVSLTFTIVTGLTDGFPALRRLPRSWILVTGSVCVISALLAIPLVSVIGMGLHQACDLGAYSNMWIFCAFELLVVTWVYGFERFSEDLCLMYGSRPYKMWWFLWGAVTLFLTIMVYLSIHIRYNVFSFVQTWTAVVTLILLLLSIVAIPVYGSYKFYKSNPTDWNKAVHPDPSWGPALEEERQSYLASLEHCNPRGIQLAESLSGGQYEMVPQ